MDISKRDFNNGHTGQYLEIIGICSYSLVLATGHVQ
jgi:hypothetical protein